MTRFDSPRIVTYAGLAAVGLLAGLVLGRVELVAVAAPFALAAVAWVRLAARGARVTRAAGPHTVVEEDPWPLRLELRTGLLPPPGGELVEPLLGWPVPE